MDLKSHRAISSILVSNLRKQTDKKISSFFFKLGSMMPDINPVLRVSEHHISVSQKYVERFVKRSKSTSIRGFRLSYLLGKTSHYIADTFCAAHNIEMGKNLAKHYVYEKALAKVLINMKESKCMHHLTEDQNFDHAFNSCVIEYILKNNKDYTGSHDGTHKLENLLNDIVNTIVHSIHVLNAMVYDYSQFELPTPFLPQDLAA